ncbi:MAG: hemoglobin [Alteromonadaceae bacterium]
MTFLLKKLLSKPTNAPSVHPTPQLSPYQIIGSERGTRNLANRFYDIMQSDPKAAELLAIHPHSMPQLHEKFFEYLSGYLGGPGLYEKKYGHPRLRARHLPFEVSELLKQQWMYCMDKALDVEIDNPLLRAQLRQSFNQLATHMINC